MHTEQRPVALSDQADDRGPRAFPISAHEFFDRGMLLRDYFAAAALTGLLAWSPNSKGQYAPDAAAEKAYEMADAMLIRRKDR